MTTTRSIVGATAWAMVSITMTFAALEPVEAAKVCSVASPTTTQVCARLAADGTGRKCWPVLA